MPFKAGATGNERGQTLIWRGSRNFLTTNAAQVADGRLHASLQGRDDGRINDHPDIRRVFEGFHM